jgi:hypothetical protein
MIRHDLEDLLQQAIPLGMFTDFKCLLDVLTRATYTAERRLMIDAKAARQDYPHQDISDIGLIRSEFNNADTLTKQMVPTQLYGAMAGRLCSLVAQWILR